jgi:hypothetical protein
MKALRSPSYRLAKANVRHQRPVIHRCFLLLLAIGLLTAALPAHAQFGWDDEPVTDTDLDQFNTALRTPAIEPILPSASPHAVSLRSAPTFDPPPVTPPAAAPVSQPFVAPVVDVDPLVEQCDLDPEIARVYRAAEIVEDDGDCPEHRSAVRSGWIPHAGPAGRHERERRSQFIDLDQQPVFDLREPVFLAKSEQPVCHAGTALVRGLTKQHFRSWLAWLQRRLDS